MRPNIRISNKVLDEILKARDEFWDNHGIGCYSDPRLDGAIFSGCYPNRNFSKLDLRNASFAGCYLVETKFEYCNLENADFTGAQLRFATFHGAALTNTNFTDAKLGHTDFSGNDISTCIFSNVTFKEDVALRGRRERRIIYTKVTNVVFSEDQQISQEFLDYIKRVKARMENNKVFIVHGHDEAMKEAVARVIERLDLKPIILHEQANQGRSILGKLQHHSDVKYAVILLSPCDEGRKRNIVNPEELKARARQNVILELGYFIGKIGLQNTCTLLKESVEQPSDFTGIIYTPFDDAGAWKTKLGQELREAGFVVDLNKL